MFFNSFGKFLEIATKPMLSKDGTNPLVQISYFPQLIRILYDAYLELSDHYDIIKENVGTTRVDAVILTAFFAENGLYLPFYYKCPTILLSPIGPVPHWSHYFGNPENPSYQPDTRMPFIEPMNFMERVSNTLYYSFLEILQVQPRMIASVYSKKGLMKYEEIMGMYYNMSLLLQSSHFVTHNSQPKMANTVEIGGIHCRQGQPLPEDLRTFLDDAVAGAVYVSFGSAIKSSLMSKERLNVFLETFREISYPVIWKFDEDSIPNLPPNVILKKWLPQQDLLAHPNLKVFVSHGGIFSLQEALYHKTPLVGIPLGTDQKPNLLRAERHGYAIMLDWQTLNKTGLTEAINRVMNDPVITQNTRRVHKLFTDEKETPVERAVWWVEYVIRHEGAGFLKPESLGLSFYQYHLLDVMVFLSLVVMTTIFLFCKCCICCKRICCRKSEIKRKIE